MGGYDIAKYALGTAEDIHWMESVDTYFWTAKMNHYIFTSENYPKPAWEGRKFVLFDSGFQDIIVPETDLQAI